MTVPKNLLTTLVVIGLLSMIAVACGGTGAEPTVTATTVILDAHATSTSTVIPEIVAGPTGAPSPPTAVPPDTTPTPVQRQEQHESFTVHDLDIEPLTGSVFETLLSKLPDNQATREYTRLGDVAGVIAALGFDPLRPGIPHEEQTQYFEDLVTADFNGFFVPLWEWPAELRDYQSRLDIYPDMAFDWISVDQFAHSDNFTFRGDAQPRSYDVALGAFDPAATMAALAQCDCDQPEIREHGGIEYFAWGDGNGNAEIQRRLARPYYDVLGRGPHLLIRDGEAYYTVRDGVIDEHIDVIQGTSPSLAEVEEYVSAVQWIASMGIVNEITLRNKGFSLDEIVQVRRGQVTTAEIVQETSLLMPFTMVATGIGYDGERSFSGLVVAHEDAAIAESNLKLLLTRLGTVTPARRGSSYARRWSYLVDRVEIQTSGRFLIARIYFTLPGTPWLMDVPNSLLVHS